MVRENFEITVLEISRVNCTCVFAICHVAEDPVPNDVHPWLGFVTDSPLSRPRIELGTLRSTVEHSTTVPQGSTSVLNT